MSLTTTHPLNNDGDTIAVIRRWKTGATSIRIITMPVFRPDGSEAVPAHVTYLTDDEAAKLKNLIP